MFQQLFQLIYSAIDSCWLWFRTLFYSIGLDGQAIVLSIIFSSAVLILFVRPFLGQAFSPKSDTVDRRR